MQQLKFRGREPMFGQWFAGTLLREGQIVMISNGTARYVVEPASVQQLLGVDRNGFEIYEDDLVKPRRAPRDMAYHANVCDFDLIIDGKIERVTF